MTRAEQKKKRRWRRVSTRRLSFLVVPSRERPHRDVDPAVPPVRLGRRRAHAVLVRVLERAGHDARVAVRQGHRRERSLRGARRGARLLEQVKRSRGARRSAAEEAVGEDGRAAHQAGLGVAVPPHACRAVRVPVHVRRRVVRAEGVAEHAVADASARVVDTRPHQKRPSVFVFEPPAEHALWPVQPLADLRAEFVRRPERALLALDVRVAVQGVGRRRHVARQGPELVVRLARAHGRERAGVVPQERGAVGEHVVAALQARRRAEPTPPRGKDTGVDAPAAIVNGLDDADAVVVARAETSAKKASSVSAPPSSPTRRRFAAPRDADAGSALASSADGSRGSGRGARMGARSHIAIAVAMRR
eukprot:CAMPEP_0203007464 /NCGR_PEP_ID=MMETSP1401-20130829/6224_1 /ASSEMBLY_ACC=CAM_ASM_000894 /TAXON_ID=38833 /ORGANISM="Micromonas pusilla, Strain CCAC1681" /LENGTH=361 /DNA_ID=CAMNT_0049749121 /DNA_START=158 /DNA_END=1241 /DNA_ORIENTATION=-